MTQDQDYSFGTWVGHRRRSLDLTQPELAARLHCSVNTIKKIETDARRPSKQLAELMAVQLGIPREQRTLFVECARGLRPVDVLQRLEPGQATAFIPSPKRFQSGSPLPSVIIGRETELNLLARLMIEARLVTLTGPGGIGKSTLAQAVRAHWHSQGIRVAFIPLVDLDSADYIPLRLASALGLAVESDPKQQSLAYLQDKKMLLVFDNFEHLLEGAPFLGEILQQTTNVTVLVTSRERLRLGEEQVFPLQGLRYPENFTSEDLTIYPASHLFLAAARRLLPDFEPADPAGILRICQVTEGMPLALEMAASWVDTMSLAEIVTELNRNLDILIQDRREVPSRHRSMRAVFDSSWQHLSATERDVFCRLCLFRGGFTRSSAEVVAGAIPSVLASLVRRSMVRLNPANGRYSIHELLRLYGEEHLKMSQTFQEAQTKYLRYFLEMAETIQSSLHTWEQMQQFNRLEEEQDNIRAALSWSFDDSEQKETAAELVLALCWYWRIRSHVVEGRGWVERALQVDPSSVPLRAGLRFHAGHFGWMQNDAEFAYAQEQISLQLWQSMGSDGINGCAYVHSALGMIADLASDSVKSYEHWQVSLSLFEESHDEWGVSFVKMHLGAHALQAGDLDTAGRLLQEGEHYFRTCGDEWALGLLLGFYGWMEFQRGNLDEAERIAREALAIRQRIQHVHSILDSVDLLAQIAIQKHDRDAARQLLELAIEISAELGNQKMWAESQDRLRSL